MTEIVYLHEDSRKARGAKTNAVLSSVVAEKMLLHMLMGNLPRLDLMDWWFRRPAAAREMNPVEFAEAYILPPSAETSSVQPRLRGRKKETRRFPSPKLFEA